MKNGNKKLKLDNKELANNIKLIKNSDNKKDNSLNKLKEENEKLKLGNKELNSNMKKYRDAENEKDNT